MVRAGGHLKTWADVAELDPPSQSIDRDAGEGPPRCCKRRIVAADALVWYDELGAKRRAALLERLPHLEGVAPLYLCDSCSELLIREEIITREERAVDFGETQKIIDKARDQDLRPAHVAAIIEDRLRVLSE
jgi:hypothetical protein